VDRDHCIGEAQSETFYCRQQAIRQLRHGPRSESLREQVGRQVVHVEEDAGAEGDLGGKRGEQEEVGRVMDVDYLITTAPGKAPQSRGGENGEADVLTHNRAKPEAALVLEWEAVDLDSVLALVARLARPSHGYDVNVVAGGSGRPSLASDARLAHRERPVDHHADRSAHRASTSS
jgi:hypothetical protein